MYPPATQMLIIAPYFFTLLRHYLALIYLKRPCLIIYSCCCACTVLFFTSGYILELAPLLLVMYPMSFGINYYIISKKNGVSCPMVKENCTHTHHQLNIRLECISFLISKIETYNWLLYLSEVSLTCWATLYACDIQQTTKPFQMLVNTYTVHCLYMVNHYTASYSWVSICIAKYLYLYSWVTICTAEYLYLYSWVSICIAEYLSV